MRTDIEFVMYSDPGNDQYDEVAAFASRALVTLGPHGGQLLSVAFMTPGTAVVEIR